MARGELPGAEFNCKGTRLVDMSPLRGMKLKGLWAERTNVTDLALLKDMPLEDIRWPVDSQRDAALLRSFRSLTPINTIPAPQFWKEFDAKQPGKP